MTSEQIKKAEKRLEAAEITWTAKKLELDRRIEAATITLETLAPKVEALKVTKAKLQTDIQALTDDHQAALSAAQQVEADTLKLQRENGEARQALRDIDELITARKAEIDSDESAYAKSQRAQMDSALSEQRAEIAAAINTLDSLTAQVQAKRDELSTINAAIIAANNEQAAQLLQNKQELMTSEAKLPGVKAELMVLHRQLNEAKLEHELVVSATNKAKIEHENFLRYESNARKALATKDQELQERSAQLDQGSRHLKAARSFLPPMS